MTDETTDVVIEEQEASPTEGQEPVDVNKLPPRGAMAFVGLLLTFYVLYFFWIYVQIFVMRGA